MQTLHTEALTPARSLTEDLLAVSHHVAWNIYHHIVLLRGNRPHSSHDTHV